MADEDNAIEGAAEKSGGGMMKMVMFGGIAVVLLGVGIFAGPAIKNMISPPPEVVEEGGDSAPKTDPALYTSLHPPLVVNFKDSVGDSHFMQITMEVMSRDQAVINSVRDHTAAIRNSLILLYSGAIYEEVTTRDGKEKMLADGLAEIQKVMSETTGEDGVEAVYFTSLVIQ
jgi:flagellar FliL protein